ncbi:hypothetical protein HDU79_006125 [Rhizoclosmatium sp. JEL0117]|nr:hypothetical protein HDU79_006125 [Rhizoclosmatium sp. JEL0117]
MDGEMAVGCSSYLPSFVETFSRPSPYYVADAPQVSHCPACGFSSPSQSEFGAQLPSPYTSETGFKGVLSATPCAIAGSCCVGKQCGTWAGPHLTTGTQCFQFGTIEMEAYLDMPQTTNGMFFLGGYIQGTQTAVDGPGDSVSWNEIDVGLKVNTNSSFEFHPTYFSPIESKVVQYFPASYSRSWHKYRVEWSPSSLEWFVDGVSARRVVPTVGNPVPWRAMDSRIIFRTLNQKAVTSPDATIYIRKITYTPSGSNNSTISGASGANAIPSTISTTGTRSAAAKKPFLSIIIINLVIALLS